MFIGPVGDKGGPQIKHKVLLKYLDCNSNFTIVNTSNKSLTNRIKSIFKLLIAKDPQIIAAIGRKGGYIIYPILNLKKKINTNLRYSIICIGSSISTNAMQHPFLLLPALKNSDLVTVETEILKEKLEKIDSKINLYYMPNYKETLLYIDSQKNHINDNDDEMKFVYLSSIRNIKGVGTMVNVFRKVVEKYPQVILDIYGPIREDFDKQKFLNMKETPQITYRGAVQNHEVVELLSRYRFFVFPTEAESEGFPAVIIEAYLAGLIIIASDFNHEIVQNGVNGWTFPAGDQSAFEKAILNCFDNKNKLEEISNYNKKSASQFDAKLVIDQYKQALINKGWNL